MAWKPDYTTLAVARQYKGLLDSVDDDELSLAITAASRAIDRAANRQFGVVASAEARYYGAEFVRQHGVWRVKIDDVMTTTGFAVALDLDDDLTYSTALTASDWRLFPLNAEAESEPWTTLEIRSTASSQPSTEPGQVEVTALYGWTSIPDDIAQACLIQVSRIFERRHSPFGIAGLPIDGSELRLLPRLDPDVAVMVRPRWRVWGAR